MTDETDHDPTHPDQRLIELEAKIAELETRTAQRLIQAELKTHAARAGMIDLDALKLVDPSRLTLDVNDEVTGAAQLMSELRRAKPYLFRPTTTSSPSAAPSSAPQAAKRATEMTHAEWQTARAALLKR